MSLAPNMLKWKILKNVFLMHLFIFMVLVSGKHIYHERDTDENRSELYFNGAESEKTNDPLSKLTEADLPKDGELFEGDMVMDSALRRAVLGEEENKKSAVYTSEEGGPKHWPNGRIPYIIDPSLDPEIQKEIPLAIDLFNNLTCVRFVPKQPDDVNYVVFKDGEGCSSSVGRKGGEQHIKLAEGCKRFGTVQHEMMHAMGIIHEQSRPDRDLYVKVIFENIKHDLIRNFQKYPYRRADTLGITYNYNSIMQYSNHAFTENGKDTLVSLFDESLRFGQRKMATVSDIRQINILYPCAKDISVAEKYLTEDMTAEKVVQKRRDALRDERLREFVENYL